MLKTDIPNILAHPLENNILEWRFAIFDLPEPYSGGVYHGKIVFPSEYPLKPPSVQMLTPSGRFQTNTRICMSMTDFHPETWNPSWRVETLLLGLVSFMLDAADPATAGGLNESFPLRQHHALQSFSLNSQDRIFRKLFPELCDESKFVSSRGFYFRISVPPLSSSSMPVSASPSTYPVKYCEIALLLLVLLIAVAAGRALASKH